MSTVLRNITEHSVHNVLHSRMQHITRNIPHCLCYVVLKNRQIWCSTNINLKFQITLEAKIAWRTVRGTRQPFNRKTATYDSIIRWVLAQQLLYLITNVWRSTILHKDCLLETLSLLKLWNNKRISWYFSAFMMHVSGLVWVMVSKENGPITNSAVKPHQTVTLMGFRARCRAAQKSKFGYFVCLRTYWYKNVAHLLTECAMGKHQYLPWQETIERMSLTHHNHLVSFLASGWFCRGKIQ